jgi:hypothetical protein
MCRSRRVRRALITAARVKPPSQWPGAFSYQLHPRSILRHAGLIEHSFARARRRRYGSILRPQKSTTRSTPCGVAYATGKAKPFFVSVFTSKCPDR